MVESNNGNGKPRLLSPIRSFEGAVRVIQAGTDEIYCGVNIPEFKKFMLYRGSHCNISNYHELRRVVNYAHDFNVDVIVTINKPFTSEVIEKGVKAHIRSCLDEGVDAFIIGDMGTLSIVKDMGVSIPLYASTYMASMNKEAVEFLGKLGFSRVILERQLMIPEIKEIAQHSKVEIEVFIHGTGCSHINVSCYLFHYAYPEMTRAMLTLNGIKLPCVLPFDVFDVDQKHEKLSSTPILDAFRFCSICRLPWLIKTGVTGFKIVGRCLNEKYQENTTKIYRELIDIVYRDDMKAFTKKLESLREKFIPLKRDLPLTNLKELCCDQKRCYYFQLLHTPYKIPITWQTWTKHQFKFIHAKSAVSEE